MKRLMEMQTGKYIDMHTHVLPGVDDGARDWDMCLKMLRKSVQFGVGVIIATPHYVPWKQGANAKEIRRLCTEAQRKFVRKFGIPIDIYPGNEIYYDLEVIEKLKKGEVLTLAGSRYVLVEFSTMVPYQTVCRAVKDFSDNGYIPILAHIERYRCMQRTERMKELRDMGALFQMDVDAFQKSFLNAESRWAKGCLLDKQIDFLASDMHDLKGRPPLAEEQMQWIFKKLDLRYQKKLLYENSRKILLGR